MTTGDGSAVFLDTNTLVYATVAEAPFHLPALTAVQLLEQAGTTLWLSRQILREYLSTLSRPQTWMAVIAPSILTEQIRSFETRFRVAEDNSQVTARLLDLIEHIAVGGRQVHDANIVATMLIYGVRRLLTHNVADFRRFSHLIDVEPLIV